MIRRRWYQRRRSSALGVRRTHERAYSGHPVNHFVLFVLPIWLWLRTVLNRAGRGELPSQSEQQIAYCNLTDEMRNGASERGPGAGRLPRCRASNRRALMGNQSE